MENKNAGPSSGDGHIVPCLTHVSPSGSTSSGDGDPTLMTTSGTMAPWEPSKTPELVSPTSSQGKGAAHRRKCRRSLYRQDEEIVASLQDSGSECEYADGDAEDDGDIAFIKLHEERKVARQLRCRMDEDEDEDDWTADEIFETNEGRMQVDSAAAPPTPVGSNFVWSEDYASFTGQRETYLRVPGPTFSSQDPSEIFLKIWDPEFMETIVEETNRYACETISKLSDPDIGTGIPKCLDAWTEVTVEELYRFFSVLIYMSFCVRSDIQEYWHTGSLGMPVIGKLMSQDRFLLISKFLHFANNDTLLTRGCDRKVEKVAPIVEHCNRKFSEMYTPSQYLSLDESLLLWKGHLSWKQCIRSKAARFGIKSFELCESGTGYLLRYSLYTGKSADLHSVPKHGFKSHTAKVVLDLMEGYLNVGHTVVMDNWYNQLALTRYLKSQRTDVLGTLDRRRKGIPQVIKDINPSVERGMSVSRHSGDISLVAWKDVKLVTVISTYHKHEMVPARRAGQTIQNPVSVLDYNRYMGGVDLKDQKIAGYLMERKRAHKWYMKVFKRLLNTSLLNAFIIYTRNPMYRVYSHRQFRLKVAEGLLSRYAHDRPYRYADRTPTTSDQLRLRPGLHFPEYPEAPASGKKERRQMHCVRCAALKKRVAVTLICRVCKVALCVGKCWQDFHTLANLT